MISELEKIIEEIRKDKGIDKEILIGALENALVKAAKNKYGQGLDIEAQYNEEIGEIELFQFKSVVEKVEDRANEILLKDALANDPEAQVGDEIGVKMDTAQFGRIAAQTARQVITQNIRDAERENVYNDYKDKKGELVTGYFQRFDKGDIIVIIGKYEAVLPSEEQIPGEKFSMRDRVKGYVLDVKKYAKGPQIVLSRTHPGFLLKLFELEVPEVMEGIVKIHNAAREPGIRAKISVESFDSRVDPVGACVGNRGARVQNIVHELHGERIDIIPWTSDPVEFVRTALAPAEVSEIIVDEDNRSMEIIVDEDQFSLAIGRRGQNVRLASKLSGWKIDIRNRSNDNDDSEANKTDIKESAATDNSPVEGSSNSGIPSAASVREEESEKVEQRPGADTSETEESV